MTTNQHVDKILAEAKKLNEEEGTAAVVRFLRRKVGTVSNQNWRTRLKIRANSIEAAHKQRQDEIEDLYADRIRQLRLVLGRSLSLVERRRLKDNLS